MKIVDFQELDKVSFALTEVSVIYQTPVWDHLGVKNGTKGRKLNGFLLIDKGRCRYEWNGGEAELSPGSLIYLGTGCKKHVTVIERPFSFYRVCFRMLDAETGEQIIFDDKPWVVTRNAGKSLFSFCDALLKTTLSRGESLKSSSLLLDLLYTLSKQLQPASACRVQPALDYLEAHYTEDITVEHLAELCALSQSQFFAAFKKTTGLSPVRYKNQLRIEQAKLLLASEECSSQEIAEMLGFENIYYFSRVFSSYTGISPSQYQRSRIGHP